MYALPCNEKVRQGECLVNLLFFKRLVETIWQMNRSAKGLLINCN